MAKQLTASDDTQARSAEVGGALAAKDQAPLFKLN